ncbi:hypothetical protein ACIA8O_07085 [Kitasatospora sp. NPDC051853]|uniref:hypothetical protein n=1 Tax=Kitasatospora sp. NPDC051853 TaxID=3364058 RepID=UPI00379E88A4
MTSDAVTTEARATTATAATATATATTVAAVPRWAERTVRLIPWLGLPVCLWRLPIGFGFLMGLDMPRSDQPLWVTVPYVAALSLLSEAFALLCLVLVRPWGEVVPAGLPLFRSLRGRRVPPAAVVVPMTVAGLGLSLLTLDWLLCTFGLLGFQGVGFTGAGWALLGQVTSGLFCLWGPLVLTATYAYHRRRRAR